jgi:hypothetical protein
MRLYPCIFFHGSVADSVLPWSSCSRVLRLMGKPDSLLNTNCSNLYSSLELPTPFPGLFVSLWRSDEPLTKTHVAGLQVVPAARRYNPDHMSQSTKHVSFTPACFLSKAFGSSHGLDLRRHVEKQVLCMSGDYE